MKRRETISPDLTPLIDVVFLLLIFFMVSTVFKKDELALQLNLPKTSASALEATHNQVNIELSRDYIALGGVIVSFGELEKNIALNITTFKQKPIIIRIDKQVEYERVTKVLDILQKYDLTNLALVTD